MLLELIGHAKRGSPGTNSCLQWKKISGRKAKGMNLTLAVGIDFLPFQKEEPGGRPLVSHNWGLM